MFQIVLALSVAQPAPFQIMGVGTLSCGSYSATKNQPVSRGVFNQWLLGFLSGYNIDNSRRIADITAATDNDGMTNWLDNYCAAHPLLPFATATGALVEELKSELQRSHNSN